MAVQTTDVTEAQRQQLKRFFEQTRPLPQLLSTVRSRRVGLGYSIDGGAPETRPSGRSLTQSTSPLSFRSEHETVPLTEVEEAIVAWAACGPNGLALWDIALNGGFHELVTIAGRTAAAPGNSFAHDLLIVKDEGVFLYNPGSERSKMVEIEGEEDYDKILRWYREGTVKLRDGRPDVDWGLRPPDAPTTSLFGPYQYNLNREGQTWFIPITDIGWLYFSAMLNHLDAWHYYMVDDVTGEPAGFGPWVGEGKLEFPVTISQYEFSVFQGETYPVGSYVQNMRLAAEAMGLGAWIFCGYFDDILMGARPDITAGLGFDWAPFNEKAPLASGAMKTFGVDGVKEATFVPSPRYGNGRELIEAMLAEKYEAGCAMSPGEDNWMLQRGGPFKADVVRQIVNHPGTQISDWAAEAAIAYVDYCVDRYGQCPVYFNPMQCNFGAVVHHVDPAFYERFYAAECLTPQIREHMSTWH